MAYFAGLLREVAILGDKRLLTKLNKNKLRKNNLWPTHHSCSTKRTAVSQGSSAFFEKALEENMTLSLIERDLEHNK